MSNDGDLGDENDFGMFSGVAVANLRQVKPRAKPHGVEIDISCQNCGKEPTLILSWPEVVCLKCGVSPDKLLQANGADVPMEWFFGADQNENGVALGPPTYRPHAACACGRLLPLRVLPGEFEAWLRNGRSHRYVHPNMEQKVTAAAQELSSRQSAMQPRR